MEFIVYFSSSWNLVTIYHTITGHSPFKIQKSEAGDEKAEPKRKPECFWWHIMMYTICLMELKVHHFKNYSTLTEKLGQKIK